MRELPQWEFDIYALSLPRGHGFGHRPPVGAWRNDDGMACGIVTKDVNDGSFGFLVMRRRVDLVWATTTKEHGFASKAEACVRMAPLLKEGEPHEPLPPGTARRPALHDLNGRTPSDVFMVLARSSHVPAAWVLNQLYLALPTPDRNWVSDCQTANFHTRLWEAQLLASFREQGLLVTQPHKVAGFPDREHARWGSLGRGGDRQSSRGIQSRQRSAQRRAEFARGTVLRSGGAAVRQDAGEQTRPPLRPAAARHRQAVHDRYRRLPGAGVDDVGPREGLIGYLYGQGAEVAEVNGRQQAVRMPPQVNCWDHPHFPPACSPMIGTRSYLR